VQENADRHRSDLTKLDHLLTQISENPEPIGPEFEVQLKKLKVRIMNMVVDSKLSSTDDEGTSLRDRLEELISRLSEVEVVVEKANMQLDDAQYQGGEASHNVLRGEVVINRARESLKNAKNHMDVDGREALRKAQERSRKFGEGNEIMSQLAGKARRLAESQEEDASEIESIASEANTISTDAYKKARDALEEQVETANQIELLETQLKDMGAKLAEVETDSQETKSAATAAYMNALTIYQTAFNLEVPEVDTSGLADQASRVTKDAERIQEDAERLITEHDELLTTAMNKRQELSDLLNSALAQQQQIDSQMAGMDEHRAKALKAVELGNTVLEEAKVTLATLQDFENRVNENKEAADEAIKKIADIKRTIEDSNEKTAAASEALENTDEKAFLAHEVAIESKTTAESASEHAKTIAAESIKIKDSAEQLNKDSQSLQAKYDYTSELVANKTRKTSEEDAQLAAEALREANKAQSSSLEATQKVEQAKSELEEISQILSSIEEQDSSSLDELERRLDAAEQKYIEANLEARLKELEEAKQRQLLRRAELKNEHTMVKEEVDTIEDIISQLPDFCPNDIEHGLEN